jgi:hypothetical protein
VYTGRGRLDAGEAAGCCERTVWLQKSEGLKRAACAAADEARIKLIPTRSVSVSVSVSVPPKLQKRDTVSRSAVVALGRG